MAMTKTGTIKSVLIITILLLVVVLGVLGMNTAKTYLGGASADTEPKSVLAKPGEDGKTSTITWMSDKSTVGIVEYGTSPAALLLRAPESDSSLNHSVVLSPLKSETNYYFRIRVGEDVFDNNGIPYSFKTKASGVAVVPTVAQVAAVPTIVTIKTECKKTDDYNNDGVVNTMDYINCVRKNPNVVAAPLPTTANAGKCASGTDYNKDGVVNSLDRIKCLQNK